MGHSKAIKKKEAEAFVKALDLKLFKALSEPTRIQILKCLIQKGRSDINAIAVEFPQDRSVISRHLNFMFEAGLLSCEKQSRHVYYAVDKAAFQGKLQQISEKINHCLEYLG